MVLVHARSTGVKSGKILRVPRTISTTATNKTFFVGQVKIALGAVMERMPVNEVFATDNDVGKHITFADVNEYCWLPIQIIIGDSSVGGVSTARLHTSRQHSSFGCMPVSHCSQCDRTYLCCVTGCFPELDDNAKLNEQLIAGKVWLGVILTTKGQLMVEAVALDLLNST